MSQLMSNYNVDITSNMGNFVGKCLRGETDVNGNGVPDNKDIQKLVGAYVQKRKDIQNKKHLRNILRVI